MLVLLDAKSSCHTLVLDSSTPIFSLNHSRSPHLTRATRTHNHTTFIKKDYVFDYQGSSPLVSGMYFDDWWPGTRERGRGAPPVIQYFNFRPQFLTSSVYVHVIAYMWVKSHHRAILLQMSLTHADPDGGRFAAVLMMRKWSVCTCSVCTSVLSGNIDPKRMCNCALRHFQPLTPPHIFRPPLFPRRLLPTSPPPHHPSMPPETGNFPDPFPNMKQDMGLTPDEQLRISKSYQANMAVIYAEMLKRGMFTWQQQWNGQADPAAKNGCCTRPLVSKGATCASTLRKLCAADSPSQTRVMNFAFSPGSCDGGKPGTAAQLTAPTQDIANFLLIRGPHAFLGHGWIGCSRTYQVPEQINWDYGEPKALCTETAPNSGVFTREWTKATVQMDCNTWTPTITLK